MKLATTIMTTRLRKTITITADDGSAEWAAAIALASRRRLGPYREKPRDADTDRRDLAAFARGGISYAVAKRLMALDEPPA